MSVSGMIESLLSAQVLWHVNFPTAEPFDLISASAHVVPADASRKSGLGTQTQCVKTKFHAERDLPVTTLALKP